MGAMPRVRDLRAFSRARGTFGRVAPARRDRARRASRRRSGRSVASRVASAAISARPARDRRRPVDAEPPEHRLDQRLLEAVAPSGEHVGQRRRFGDQRQASGQLREIPVDRLGLPAERVQAVMVEIGGGEVGVPLGREAPRAVIEALAGDVDIVAVEHAVDEPRGEIGGGEARGRLADQIEQPQRIVLVVGSRLLAIEIVEAIADELRDVRRPRRKRRGAGTCRCGCGRG